MLLLLASLQCIRLTPSAGRSRAWRQWTIAFCMDTGQPKNFAAGERYQLVRLALLHSVRNDLVYG